MYKRYSSGWLKHFDFIILDIICLQISFYIGCQVRLGGSVPYAQEFYREVMLMLVLMDLVVMFFSESYKGILGRGVYKELVCVVKHCSGTLLLMTAYLYFVKRSQLLSRLVFVYTWGFWILLSFLFRILWKRYLIERAKTTPGARSLLVVSTSDRIDQILSRVDERGFDKIQISGIVLLDVDYDSCEDAKWKGYPLIEDGDTVLEYIKRKWVDEIFVDVRKELPLPEKILNLCVEAGVTVHLTLSKLGVLEAQKHEVGKVAGYTVLSSSVNMASPKELLAKRLMDIAGGIVGCILTAILFVFVAPAIYIKSPGPIFFSQERIGRNGRRFKIYKFRSMYMDAEERKKELMKQNRIQDGMMFKMEDDPRIIKGIGHFIRDYSIDEFPQFWNVLKGDMSLVGTRPPTVDEWEKYELHHRARMAIKPGLTGLWQVSGRSSITDFDEVVKLDMAYITEWSIAKDIRILFQTVGVVLGKKGSM